MYHFVTEMCTYVHISVTKWCIVGYLSDALWDLWVGSNGYTAIWTRAVSDCLIRPLPASVNALLVNFVHQRAKNCPTMTKISKDHDTHNISVCTKSEASIWFVRPWMQINDFDLFLAVKQVKVSRLKWNSNLMCNTTYCMYIPSFKLIYQNM